MKKYRSFKFGKCYINKSGDFAVALLRGSKKNGYVFACSHAKPCAAMRTLNLLSRIIPNDGEWTEVFAKSKTNNKITEEYAPAAAFWIISRAHSNGIVFQVPRTNRTRNTI